LEPNNSFTFKVACGDFDSYPSEFIITLRIFISKYLLNIYIYIKLYNIKCFLSKTFHIVQFALKIRECTPWWCTVLLVGPSRNRFLVVLLGIFSVILQREPCALRSTQSLKVSTRDFSWVKSSRFIWLMNYHQCSAETSRKSTALIYPEPLGPPRPVVEDIYFTLLYNLMVGNIAAETCRC